MNPHDILQGQCDQQTPTLFERALALAGRLLASYAAYRLAIEPVWPWFWN